jgi:PAB-dependent poly(A)-specific ribonuclease subunit 2
MCAFPCAGDFPDGIYGVNLRDDWTYARGAEVDGLMTMTFTSQAASEVLAGGQTNYLVLFNVDRGTILKQVPSTNWYTKMRRGRVICAADASGNIAIIDPRASLEPQFLVEEAHTGGIEDIDTQDNTLLTCGWTYRYPPHPFPSID